MDCVGDEVVAGDGYDGWAGKRAGDDGNGPKVAQSSVLAAIPGRLGPLQYSRSGPRAAETSEREAACHDRASRGHGNVGRLPCLGRHRTTADHNLPAPPEWLRLSQQKTLQSAGFGDETG